MSSDSSSSQRPRSIPASLKRKKVAERSSSEVDSCGGAAPRNRGRPRKEGPAPAEAAPGGSKKRAGTETREETWAQCDACGKWRVVDERSVPTATAEWTCALVGFSCDAPDEPLERGATWREAASVVEADALAARHEAEVEGLVLHRILPAGADESAGADGGVAAPPPPDEQQTSSRVRVGESSRASSGQRSAASKARAPPAPPPAPFVHVHERESALGTPYSARVALGGGVVQDLGSFISAERAALTAQRFVNLIAPQGPELVGRSIDVYWPVDGAWYTAEVRSVTDEGAFLVFYPADQYEEELMLGSAVALRFHASTVTEEGAISASGSTAHTWRRFLALERRQGSTLDKQHQAAKYGRWWAW